MVMFGQQWKRCHSRRCRLLPSDQDLVSECRGFTSLLFIYLWSIGIASLVRNRLMETAKSQISEDAASSLALLDLDGCDRPLKGRPFCPGISVM